MEPSNFLGLPRTFDVCHRDYRNTITNGFQRNSIGGTVRDLVSCSKYHFEEHILERLIRMEHTIELHKISMEKWEKRIDDKSELTDVKVTNVVTEVKAKVGENLKRLDQEEDERRNSFKKLQNDLASTLSAIIDNFTTQSENFSAVFIKNQDSLKGLGEKFEKSQTSLMNDSFLKINKTLKTLVQQTKTETGNQLKKATDTLLDLEVNFNLLSGKVTDAMKTMNMTLFTHLPNIGIGTDKVILTSCAREKSYPWGKFIEFPHTKQTRNVGRAVIDTLGRTGIFTCEKAGWYLISVFIMTETHGRYAKLYVDDNLIALLHFSPKDFYQTSSVTVLRNLNVNDKVYVKIGGHGQMLVFGDKHSCMSILEVT